VIDPPRVSQQPGRPPRLRRDPVARRVAGLSTLPGRIREVNIAPSEVARSRSGLPKPLPSSSFVRSA